MFKKAINLTHPPRRAGTRLSARRPQLCENEAWAKCVLAHLGGRVKTVAFFNIR